MNFELSSLSLPKKKTQMKTKDYHLKPAILFLYTELPQNELNEPYIEFVAHAARACGIYLRSS